jgi:Family of unknown function (DUF5654)
MARRRSLRSSSAQTLRSLIQTMITLATASLGLVAALAWNDAIKATFKKVLGEADDLTALYTYAALATVLSIVVVASLSWLASRVGGEAIIDREVEG